MSLMLKPTFQQLSDFQLISSLDNEDIKNVIEQILQLKSDIISHETLTSLIEQSLGEKKRVAGSIIQQAVSLNGLSRQTGFEVDELLSSISNSLKVDSDWEQEMVDRWTTIEDDFLKLICLKTFRLTATVIDLSYEYANLYRSGRILTDIRPCYSKDAKSIEGAVISYTFRLRYDDIEGEHELSIAMDEADIENFIIQCDRALTKAKTARSVMSDKAQIDTIITGE